MSTATGALAPGGNVRVRIAAAARELFTEDVVVAVFRAGAPLDDVVQRISRTL